MFISCYASGSAGNLYKIESNKTTLLIECGLPMKDIRHCLGTTIDDVKAVLLTHEHKDHSRAIHEFLKLGIDIYTSKGTAISCGAEKSPYVHFIESEKVFFIGDITIMPFKTNHDAIEPLGFVLRDNKDILMFATDTYNIEFNVHRVSQLMIECNHSYEILDEKLKNGQIDKSRYNRLVKSHFSLENLKTWLSKNDLTCLKEIYLLHLSKQNSSADEFRQEIEAITGIPVYIADENVIKTGNYIMPTNTWECVPKPSTRSNFFYKIFREDV